MKKILIADDSKLVREMLSEPLKAKGYAVEEFPDGASAWEQLASGGFVPDLCLLDVNMPQMGGLELCEKMRSDSRFAQIPVVMITAQVAPELKAQAKTLGVRAWVLKPVVPERILAAIEKIFQE
ncbi:MAG: hypothetical protein RJB38_1128 [Pseudomonadota bacterium]